MKEVRWGMIGTGAVTEVKSGPGLYKSKNSKLLGVYNLDYDQACDWAKRHGVERVYRDIEGMLTDPEIDVVYVATPPKFHYQYTMDILKAGKIPYVEKPIANTYEECLKIKALSEEKGIPVYVAFYRRGVEKFLKIKELLQDGVIGEVRQVYVTQTQPVEESELDRERLPWRVVPAISGGGKFLDMGVHVLDCLIMYFGEIESISGVVENKGGYYDADDTVAATFKFANGITGVGNWCYVADRNENRVEIIGDRGRIIYDGLSAKRVTLETEEGSETLTFEEPEHAAMPFQQAVVDELTGKRPSQASFGQSINTVKITDMLLKEYREGLGKDA